MKATTILAAMFFAGGMRVLGAQEVPEALKRVEANRLALRTAHIEWSRANPAIFGRHPRFFTTRLAEDEMLHVSRGDEDGVFNRLPDGSIDRIQMKPYWVLSKDGQVWGHHERSWGADHFPEGAYVYHLRALGLCPGLPYRDVAHALWHDDVEQPSPRRYSERDEGPYHVVKAETDTGVLEWWLDPARGGEVIRLVHYRHGEIIAEARSTLRNYDGLWFPEAVAFFTRDYEQGKRPREIVRIHYASFNQPEHPRSFSLKDIGIEAGVHITQYDRQRRVLASGLTFDGEKPVPDAEFLERWKRGEIRLGPTMAREAAQNRARETVALMKLQPAESRAGPAARRSSLLADDPRLTAWEEYTRCFIARYKLDDEQAQRAWLVHDECQAMARGHLARIKSRLEEVEGRLNELRAGGSGKVSSEELSELEERRRQLLQPIADIFEHQLKPRLEKLPNRAQRKAAEHASTE